jgi:RHS repeat-associated protein
VALGWLYQYDAENRLKEVQYNGQVMGTYVYNGDGQRMKKTEWNPDSQQNETVIYLYVQGNVHYEKNTTTGMDALYVCGPIGRIAKKMGEEAVYYHTDHVGSTRLLTDSQGNPVTSVQYFPFGTPETSGTERYLFTGQEKDHTGMYYYKARYFDPELGRFLTRDSWSGDPRRPQSLNKYVYCSNNPLRYTDPTGSVLTGDAEIDEFLAALESEESSQSDAYQYGYLLSTIAALKFAEQCHSMGWRDSQRLMREIESTLTDPKDRIAFEQGWNKGYTEANINYASPKEAGKRCREAIEELQDDVQCLVDYVGDELLKAAIDEIAIPNEVLQATIYIAEEFYNLTCTDKYGPPPPNLTEMCKKENRGTCLGSLLLCLLFSLAGCKKILDKGRLT